MIFSLQHCTFHFRLRKHQMKSTTLKLVDLIHVSMDLCRVSGDLYRVAKGFSKASIKFKGKALSVWELNLNSCPCQCSQAISFARKSLQKWRSWSRIAKINTKMKMQELSVQFMHILRSLHSPLFSITKNISDVCISDKFKLSVLLFTRIGVRVWRRHQMTRISRWHTVGKLSKRMLMTLFCFIGTVPGTVIVTRAQEW